MKVDREFGAEFGQRVWREREFGAEFGQRVRRKREFGAEGDLVKDGWDKAVSA